MVRVTFERLDELAAGNLEGLHKLVGAAGGQLGVVGAETDAKDRVAVAVLDVEKLLAGGHFKDLYLAVLRRGAAAGRQQLAVGRKGEGDHSVCESGQLLTQQTRLCVPDDHFLKAAAGQEFAVRAEGERLDEAQVRGLNRLFVGRCEVRVGQATNVGAGAGVVDVDLVSPAGGNG